jgi:putative (di)nucleoside polyphosphate hydrolase
MNSASNAELSPAPVVSCGTLVINSYGEVLLCHVTGYLHWDLPKGCLGAGETPLEAARRELKEETSLVLDDTPFEDLGEFYYKDNKWLHLYKVHVTHDQVDPEKLVCTSYFRHYKTGQMCPEMDGFRWASRDDVAALCAETLAERLLRLEW